MNSHCIPQCCKLEKDCNWEQSQRQPLGLPTMLSGAGSAPAHLDAALSPVLLAWRTEQHPGFWDRGLCLGHPGKVTSSLGFVPARGSWRQGRAWMRWEREQCGSSVQDPDPCCCDSVLRAEPGTSGFGAGVWAAALPPVHGCGAAKVGGHS